MLSPATLCMARPHASCVWQQLALTVVDATIVDDTKADTPVLAVEGA